MSGVVGGAPGVDGVGASAAAAPGPPLDATSTIPLLFSQHVSDLHVALGRLQYTKAKHCSERSGWESTNAQTVLAFEDALRVLDRERDELVAEVDYHHSTCRSELEAARDRCAAEAGAAAVLADIDRQCRLLDDVAEAVQRAMRAHNREALVAHFPKLLRRCDDVLFDSHRLSEKATDAPRLALDDVGKLRSLRDRVTSALGQGRRGAAAPPPAAAAAPAAAATPRAAVVGAETGVLSRRLADLDRTLAAEGWQDRAAQPRAGRSPAARRGDESDESEPDVGSHRASAVARTTQGGNIHAFTERGRMMIARPKRETRLARRKLGKKRSARQACSSPCATRSTP